MKVELRKMAQSIKCLLLKHAELSLDTQHWPKMLDVVVECSLRFVSLSSSISECQVQ